MPVSAAGEHGGLPYARLRGVRRGATDHGGTYDLFGSFVGSGASAAAPSLHLDSGPGRVSALDDSPAVSLPDPAIFSSQSVALIIVGLAALFILAAALVGSFVHKAVYFLRMHSSAPFVLFFVFLSWWLPFIVVFLLPVDVASTEYRNCIGTKQEISTIATCTMPPLYVPADIQLVVWQTVYWSIFVITWVIIPFLQSYVDGGGFTAPQRLREVLRSRLIFIGIFVALGAAFAIYLLVSRIPIDLQRTKGFLMALSNAYGLFLLLLFLGYGLVNIPRSLWHRANIRRSLTLVEIRIPRLKESLEKAKPAVQRVNDKIMSISRRVPADDPLRKHVDYLIEKSSKYSANMTSSSYAADVEDTAAGSESRLNIGRFFGRALQGFSSQENVTLSELMSLHCELKIAQLDFDRHNHLWEVTLSTGMELQTVLSNASNSDWRYRSRAQSIHESAWKERCMWLWYFAVRPYFYRVASILSAAASICIVWSECVWKANLSIFELVDGYTYLICLVTFGYMALCGFVPLLSLRIFSFYQLARRSTNISSLLFFAGYLTRLSFPLCWNVLNISSREAVYSKIMNSVDLVPLLGVGFNTWLPVVLVVLCLMTLFNIHVYIMRVFGIDSSSYVADDDFNAMADREEGRIILQDALNSRAVQLSDDSPSLQIVRNGPSSADEANFGRRPFSARGMGQYFTNILRKNAPPQPNGGAHQNTVALSPQFQLQASEEEVSELFVPLAKRSAPKCVTNQSKDKNTKAASSQNYGLFRRDGSQ